MDSYVIKTVCRFYDAPCEPSVVSKIFGSSQKEKEKYSVQEEQERYALIYVLVRKTFKGCARITLGFILINSQLNSTQLNSTELRVIMIIGLSHHHPPTHPPQTFKVLPDSLGQ